MRGKVQPWHLERQAYVYVRQSTAAQVLEHGESTQRQYALVDRAVALGWRGAAIEVIDEDQGRSGASTQGRHGFARLADAVANGRAGAVLAVEVSRLARSSEDWQRLLSLCAVAQVVVVDENSIYDPDDHDDRLLLDLKGTMSEAELHWLRLRLTGGRQNKARRGALRLTAPTGYVWSESGFALDPDEAVRTAIHAIFERYEIEPSAWAVVRWARESGLQCPRRRVYAAGGTEVVWKPLTVSRMHELLNNPTYAGAYVYGRRPTKKTLVNGQIRQVRQGSGGDPEQWSVRLLDAHPGYITWERYLHNREKLQKNHTRFGGAVPGAPREGAALLGGLLVCGRCGRRMRASYRGRGSRQWDYVCGGDRDRGQVGCWSLPGMAIDRAIETLLLETVVPSELELALAVEQEAGRQAEELSHLWRARIEQAAYEARIAERRYKAVDPDNRVVARTLEREWEKRLEQLQDVERAYEEARRRKRIELSEADRRSIRSLARDLPAVWHATTTAPADRKAMLRLVIEAIALVPIEVPQRMTRLRVQWQSGVVDELTVLRPDRRHVRRTPDEAIQLIRQMAAQGERDDVIAQRLNVDGIRTGLGKQWNVWAVRWARKRNGIRLVAPDAPRRTPLPARYPDGRYSVGGAASLLGVSQEVVRRWLRQGLIAGQRADYREHRQVWWLEIDEPTTARLARRGRKLDT
jgi:DNA invertase Pin-like site-specific DNA recombinase